MMNVFISMLRGVNVGGHHKVKMDELRTLYESLGLSDVQTYVQSGNVLFATQQREFDRLAVEIEKAIEQRCGFHADVILLNVSELRDVVRRNPFATRQDIAPNKLLVTFLSRDPGQEARDKVLAMKIGPEELSFGAHEYYVHFPNGAGNSKLPTAAIERALKTPGTARNWNSVTRMLELAESMGAQLAPDSQPQV